MGDDFEFVKTLLDTYKVGVNKTVKQMNLENLRDELDADTYDLSVGEKSKIKSEIEKELEMMGIIIKTDFEELKERVDALIRYHFGGSGGRMYSLSGYLTILKDPSFSEEDKEGAKNKAREAFAWIKRKYDQIPYSELSDSPFYDDFKPLFEINKLLIPIAGELDSETPDYDRIERILNEFREFGEEYTKTVDKCYEKATGKGLGSEDTKTRALLEYRSKEQIEEQARWLKEHGIAPNSFEKAAMDYYGVHCGIPVVKPSEGIVKPEVKDELNKEGWGLHIEAATPLESREHIRVMKTEEPEYEWKTVKRPDGLVDVFVRTKEELGDKKDKSEPEAKLAEIIVTLKTNPDGLADVIEEGLSPEMKEKVAALIRTRLARKGFIESIDWERNVADYIERCEQEGGICQFRTRYAGKRFEDSQNPGKYLVLFICYGKRWSQWFGKVSEEDVERLEED